MQYNTNYHTHSTYCDGVHSLSEMAKAAFDAGIKVLGFSAHTAFPFASYWHMEVNNYEKYFYDLEVLKKEYEGRMEILAGLEAEHLPPISYCTKKTYSNFNLDFMIGSVHYLVDCNPIKGGVFTVDGPTKEVYDGVQTYFNGDGKKAVQAYFSAERDMIQNGDFDIIGHIDLFRKRNAELKLFDENDSWYRNELKETAKVAGKSGKVVEINTGGMARANLTTPYPSHDFLTLLKAENVPITINSDSHSTDSIITHFDVALEFVKSAGYETTYHLSQGKWHESPIV